MKTVFPLKNGGRYSLWFQSVKKEVAVAITLAAAVKKEVGRSGERGGWLQPLWMTATSFFRRSGERGGCTSEWTDSHEKRGTKWKRYEVEEVADSNLYE
jgi:hypothetical protein